MYIEDRLYSEYEDEVYYSVTLTEEEMRLYSEFQERLYAWNPFSNGRYNTIRTDGTVESGGAFGKVKDWWRGRRGSSVDSSGVTHITSKTTGGAKRGIEAGVQKADEAIIRGMEKGAMKVDAAGRSIQNAGRAANAAQKGARKGLLNKFGNWALKRAAKIR